MPFQRFERLSANQATRLVSNRLDLPNVVLDAAHISQPGFDLEQERLSITLFQTKSDILHYPLTMNILDNYTSFNFSYQAVQRCQAVLPGNQLTQKQPLLDQS
jgi:hypothetical protein